MRFATSCLSILFITLAGCHAAGGRHAAAESASTLAKNPNAAYTFPADQYESVFPATVEVLRSHGFRISRNDYRFGRITTYPKESPTFAEFWIDDATTSAQRRSDTLNANQRTVSITIKRAQVSEELDTETGEVAPPGYELTAEVMIQRRQEPARYLTQSVTGVLSAEYALTPRHLSDQGIDGPFAQNLSRDHDLERRLLAAIRLEANQGTAAD